MTVVVQIFPQLIQLALNTAANRRHNAEKLAALLASDETSAGLQDPARAEESRLQMQTRSQARAAPPPHN